MSFNYNGGSVNVEGAVNLNEDVSKYTTITYVGTGSAQTATVPANKVWLVKGIVVCQTGSTAGFVNVRNLGMYAAYSTSITIPNSFTGLIKLTAGQTLVYNGAVVITYQEISV